LGPSIEERSELIYVRLILAGGGACPKPSSTIADYAVGRGVASWGADYQDIPARLDRHWLEREARFRG